MQGDANLAYPSVALSFTPRVPEQSPFPSRVRESKISFHMDHSKSGLITASQELSGHGGDVTLEHRDTSLDREKLSTEWVESQTLDFAQGVLDMN